MINLKTIQIGHNIYPDISEKISNDILNFKKKFNIEINLLFEDGIELEYNESDYYVKNWLGGVCLMKNNQVIIKIIDDFDQIIFCDMNNDNKFLVIPLIENSYGL